MIGGSWRRYVFRLGTHLRSKSLRFKLELAGLILILPLVGLVVSFWLSSPNYHLSYAARLLIGSSDTAIQNELSYSAKEATFYLNQKGMNAPPMANTASIRSNFSSSLPAKLSHGITICDDTADCLLVSHPRLTPQTARTSAVTLFIRLAAASRLSTPS